MILSIDFIGGRPAAGGAGGAVLTAAPTMAATEIAGFKPAANWNGAPNIMGTLSNLVQANGVATAAAVTWSSPSTGNNPGEWKNNFTDTPGDARMMNGYLDPTATAMPATIMVSGLPATITTGGYDVYVYMTSDITSTAMRTFQYAIGSTTFTVTQTGPTPTTFPGFTLAPAGGAGNYVVFRNVTGAAFTLTATPSGTSTVRAPVSGLQIVSPTGS